MKVFISLAVLSALTSCAPAPKLERRPESFFTREKLVDGKANLDTVSISEVFRIKYENAVTLKCTLDVKAGNNIITDFREENLVGSNYKISPINLEADGHKVEVKIRPTNLTVFKNLTQTDFKENKYVMAHSPVATVDVSWKDTDSTGAVLSGSATIDLYENLPDFYVTEMSKKGITEFFRCQLRTTALPEFQHEWEKIEAAPKETPVATEPAAEEAAPVTEDIAPVIETAPVVETTPEASH